MSIKNVENHFAASDKWLKLLTGLTLPKAGPILPKEDAVIPIAETKSKPKKVKKTELKIKISIYKTKKDKILYTILG